MLKKIKNLIWIFFIVQFFLITPQVLAKKEGTPAGWGKGEKKGWQGQDLPPGLFKKDVARASKEAEKTGPEAEKVVRKAQKGIEKKAKLAEKQAQTLQKKAVE